MKRFVLFLSDVFNAIHIAFINRFVARSPVYIGAPYGGGIIFAIYPRSAAGYTVLIAAERDENNPTELVVWGFKMGNNTNDFDGSYNTQNIIAHQPTPNPKDPATSKYSDYAALRCSNSTRGGYSDWYLPSKLELSYLHAASQSVGNFFTNPNPTGNARYWSSSEDSEGKFELWASYADFSDLSGVFHTLTGSDPRNAMRVRAIRKQFVQMPT